MSTHNTAWRELAAQRNVTDFSGGSLTAEDSEGTALIIFENVVFAATGSYVDLQNTPVEQVFSSSGTIAKFKLVKDSLEKNISVGTVEGSEIVLPTLSCVAGQKLKINSIRINSSL